MAEPARETGDIEDESLACILLGSVEMEREGRLTEADRLSTFPRPGTRSPWPALGWVCSPAAIELESGKQA